MNWAELLTWESAAALLALTSLEIVLGIDNIVFIAIVTGRLPAAVQSRARQLGLLGAMAMRILLLLAIRWIMGLEADLFAVFGQEISGRDLIVLGGGLFLLGKATYEIHHRIEGPPTTGTGPGRAAASFGSAVTQIMLVDVVFSLDSVITAIGMAKQLAVMITAIVVAILIMLVFAGAVSRFIERHPTMKMLALAFLVLIGVMLVADAFEQRINRGYIYFAMAFALGVELLNMRTRRPAAAAVQTAG